MTREIIIKPILPIGTELWMMYDNKPLLCLVSHYTAFVTSYTDGNKSMYRQLFAKWLNKKAKEDYIYNFKYFIISDMGIFYNEEVKISDRGFYIRDRKAFLTEQELFNSLMA
jgi:hypothetical protein